jgi:hypothetical protein
MDFFSFSLKLSCLILPKKTNNLFIKISFFNNFILVGCNGPAKQKHQREETRGKEKEKKETKRKKFEEK